MPWLLSVAAKKGTILAAMAATGPQRFTGSLSLLTGGLVQNGPESVKGAPLLGAAKRTLDGEDRSEIIKSEGKAPARVPQSGSRKVAPSSPPLTPLLRLNSRSQAPPAGAILFSKEPLFLMPARPSPFALEAAREIGFARGPPHSFRGNHFSSFLPAEIGCAATPADRLA